MKTEIVDPWNETDTSGNDGSMNRDGRMKFEDNFVAERQPDIQNSSSASEDSFRLPDSAQYLASLEKKMEKLKSKRKGKDIVQSLEEKHKSCMEQLLSCSGNTTLSDDDFILDTPVSNNHPLLRYVAPDKQALTLGELVELVKADHLSKEVEEEEQDDNTSKPEGQDFRPPEENQLESEKSSCQPTVEQTNEHNSSSEKEPNI